MGFGANLAVVLLCWGVASYDPWQFAPRNSIWRTARPVSPAPSWPESSPWAWVDASQVRALSYFAPVAVQCGEAQVVVTVNRDLFGTGRLIQATDLSLGSSGCHYTSYDAARDVVIFDVGLHQCGSILQMTPESLVYSISLYYKPTPSANAVVIRTSPAEVPIECHYPRRSNVSSDAIKPTWAPFSSTISAEHRLGFSLRLMNDDWSAERASGTYQLGDVMYIQAEVNAENHLPLRLFVNHCVATLSPSRNATPRYPIIDHNGCLVDGRSDSSSAFVSPRLKEDLLQFTVDVFRFTGHPQELIYITCHLKVTAASQAPDPENKACSFNQANNMWIPVEGTQGICTCCETGHCGVTGGQPRRLNPWDRWARGRRSGRDVSTKHGQLVKELETDVMIGPIFVRDAYMGSRSLSAQQSETTESPEEHGFLSAPGLLAGLILMSLALLLALITFGVPLLKKCPGSH
ncbi:Zona pellucida sperm-binding protein 3 [Podarcis lilfordi]|uniref:Zona pellucida sperm-binding protein 3 n=1 Tax=Podarcis lilfordi TaxID=74358 RepID=A0AA35PC94_9SAUR|nr:Zona pellucida sperm-binding protein 3 [Podarcis lilfordi]